MRICILSSNLTRTGFFHPLTLEIQITGHRKVQCQAKCALFERRRRGINHSGYTWGHLLSNERSYDKFVRSFVACQRVGIKHTNVYKIGLKLLKRIKRKISAGRTVEHVYNYVGWVG